MNPAGKSYVCILHEYVQHALKKQPAYQFKEIGIKLINFSLIKFPVLQRPFSFSRECSHSLQCYSAYKWHAIRNRCRFEQESSES